MINKSKAALVFDISWFTSFIIIQAIPFIITDSIQHPGSFFAVALLVGGATLFCKKLKSISVVGKMFHWISFTLISPKYKYNHILWGLGIIILGIVSIVFGEKPDENELVFIRQIYSSYEYWITISVVLILNVLVGIYATIKSKHG